MHNTVGFQPNWTSIPGNTINDILRNKKLSLDEFAEMMNSSIESVKELIQGYISITNEIAEKLEKNLGASSEFWLRRESQYREDIIRLKNEQEALWLKNLPINNMIRFGWINNSKDLVLECLNFFNVPDVNTWKNNFNSLIQASSFRSSNHFVSEFGATSVWLRQGEIVGTKIECQDWNENLFEETLIKIRTLTREKDPKKFLPELTRMCAECGVAIAIVRTPEGCRASGATRFVSPQKALLQLSFRYLSDDQFWFTFFHEAGHILLHGNKTVFIEEINGQYDKTDEETEANIFAGEALIPYELQSELKTIRGNKRNIINFAMKAGVSPGIVIGQLQHHGFIDYKYLNGYKRRYNWDDIISSI
jgi:HTH-type transcriptional regulator/antitoxin HigA